MKTLRRLIVLLGMSVLAVGLCAKEFEGKVRFKMTSQERSARSASGDSSRFMDYFIKAGLIRIDMETRPGETGSMIIDPAKREMTTLVPGQKMYMVIKMPEPKPATGTAAPAQDVQIVRTGDTETILGYKCEKIIMKNKDGEAEAWSAAGLGTFFNMNRGGPMGRPSPASAWERVLSEQGFFPLRMVVRDKKAKEQMRMEAVSIDPQPLPDSTFLPPADYQKLEMPSIPGLGGLGRAMGGE